MGCFDMYCDSCGAPFTSYNPKYYPDMVNVDTIWLEEAIVEYYNKGNLKVHVSKYDSYGRFEDGNGKEHDVVGGVYDGHIKVYHKLCEGRPRSNKFRAYQEQFFNIERMIKQNKHNMLDKSNNA